MAPTILTAGNLRFVIRTKEQGHTGRPHCHVVGPGAEASIDLETFVVLASRGFDEPALREIQREVEKRGSKLMEAWHEYHE